MQTTDKFQELLAILEYVLAKYPDFRQQTGNEKKKNFAAASAEIKKSKALNLTHFKSELSLKAFLTELSKELVVHLDKKDDITNPASLLASEFVLKHYQVNQNISGVDETTPLSEVSTPMTKLLLFQTSCLKSKSEFPDLIPSIPKYLPKIFDRIALLFEGEQDISLPLNIRNAFKETISLYLDFVEGCFMDRTLHCYDEVVSAAQLPKFLILFQKTSDKNWLRKLMNIVLILGNVFKEVNTNKSRTKYLQDYKCLSFVWLGIFKLPESLTFEDNCFQFELIQHTLELMENFGCISFESYLSSYVSFLLMFFENDINLFQLEKRLKHMIRALAQESIREKEIQIQTSKIFSQVFLSLSFAWLNNENFSRLSIPHFEN